MIFAPASGCFPLYSARSAISPGISCSARRISLRPYSASSRSLTLYGSRPASIAVVNVFIGSVIVPTVRSIGSQRLFELRGFHERNRIRFLARALCCDRAPFAGGGEKRRTFSLGISGKSIVAKAFQSRRLHPSTEGGGVES